MERKLAWRKDDLVAMIGLPESARLEFKESALLKDPKGNSAKIAAELIKQMSAFANSEGGVLIIGIKEKAEGKSRVAETLDGGVSLELVGREWIQNGACRNAGVSKSRPR
jgi:predicted HTH transcriptional regulator